MSLSRRDFLALVGLSLAGTAVFGAQGFAAPRKSRRALASGWQIASAGAPRHGAVPVTLRNVATGETLIVEACRRGGTRPPVASSRAFDLYLANQGTGASETPRDHILAVRALARRLDRHQVEVPAIVITMDERLTRHAELFERA